MMTSADIRKTFIEYFEEKGHQIVKSAPIVVKDDPTLMFTNAGMNQFKDAFLGHQKAINSRIADTQKCLRVSGKHNDLEEVGRDSYHHTMFEMLGNWSFGDYFKEEAIDYAWELLVDKYGLDKERIYITVFEGDKIDGTSLDEEAAGFWKKYIPEERILPFDKKDNFWEMGDTGPCGPCSEIHYDMRDEADRAAKPGKDLVNMDDPMVIEIWNLVFIQYNRKANGELESLPEKHIDTGMGFERLCMIIQGKTANYDSDLFTPYINYLQEKTGIKYTGDYSGDSMTDIAMRVVSDHIRAVAFTIADGEMPSATGAGYVIRRILRRATRYIYSFLGIKEPFFNTLIPMLAEQFKDIFPELAKQQEFVQKVILQEEKSFLKTLEDGLKRLEALKVDDGTLSGQDAFLLYDTYGFPFDLTRLVADEKGWRVDEDGFEAALEAQKAKGRADANKEVGDWIEIHKGTDTEFLGYDHNQVEDVKVLKYRVVKEKGTDFNQLILDKTPFYAQGGGQVGDTGFLKFGPNSLKVLDTRKENNVIIHYVDEIPDNIKDTAQATIDAQRRMSIECNHTSTHLMHAALRQVLGTHVQQKGSLVKEDLLRFDFSHFEKMTDDQIKEVEQIVNQKIRENVQLDEKRSIDIEAAKAAGAMMLFGEKYGDTVRMITFDENYSTELCGGCHVSSTGAIGLFKITSETGIAAGVRRITALTGGAADAHLEERLATLGSIEGIFKNPKNVYNPVLDLQEENKKLKKQIEKLQSAQAGDIKGDLKQKVVAKNGYQFLAEKIDLADSKAAKTMLFEMEKEMGSGVYAVGMESGGKAQLMVLISKGLVENQGLNAGTLVRDMATEIRGGGGGQAFFATAGGAHVPGIEAALKKLEAALG